MSPVTDGGSDTEGGIDLYNRSLPPTCCGNGDMSTRRGNNLTCPQALSYTDDCTEMSKQLLLIDQSKLISVTVETQYDLEAFIVGLLENDDLLLRLSDYERNTAAALVIQAVNKSLDIMSATEVLSGPYAKQWIKAHETEYQELKRKHKIGDIGSALWSKDF